MGTIPKNVNQNHTHLFNNSRTSTMRKPKTHSKRPTEETGTDLTNLFFQYAGEDLQQITPIYSGDDQTT